MTKRSVLDERPVQIPVSGRIRTGIKVLNSKHASNARAKELYEAGVNVGKSYDQIDREIRAELKIEQTALVPRNVSYFRVSRSDFTYPEVADLIFDQFAEDRGNGLGTQLYRFPVVFAFDDWLSNLPHKMSVFTASGIKFWSEYDALGKRYCKTMPEATIDPTNKRAARAWGGRTPVLRQENQGLCIPETCREYQCRECKLSGRLLFYIPGVPGSSLIELDTGSIYSLKQIKAQMELVAGLRMGRLSGVYNGRPIFRVAKVEEEVSMLTDAGKAERRKQYLTYLEADLPMVDLLVLQEQRSLAAPPQAAMAALSAPPADDGVLEHGAPDQPEPPKSGESDKDAIRRLRAEINHILTARGADPEAYGLDMAMKHGANWSKNAEKLRIVKFDLES